MSRTAEIPIFPLQTVLYPAGSLPLRIFEARYVDMTKVCIRDDSVFGVCMIRQGREVGEPAQHAELGCTARIVSWDVPSPGLFSLVARGESVFRIRDRSVMPDGLIRADVDYEEPVAARPLPEDYIGLAALLQGIHQQLGPQHQPAEPRYHDAAWVCYRLAELLPLAPGQKLRLLESRDPSSMLDEIARTLKMLGLGSGSDA